MNIEEAREYVIKVYENRRFSRVLSQDEEQVVSLKEFLPNSTWHQKAEYLEVHYGPGFGLGCVTRSGDKVTNIEVFEYNYVGDQYVVEYKGITLWLYCLTNGEINRALLHFNMGFNNHLSDLSIVETIEEYYQQSLKLIQKNKRQTMNRYNRDIKNLKQEYKKELKRYNDVLKQGKQ